MPQDLPEKGGQPIIPAGQSNGDVVKPLGKHLPDNRTRPEPGPELEVSEQFHALSGFEPVPGEVISGKSRPIIGGTTGFFDEKFPIVLLTNAKIDIIEVVGAKVLRLFTESIIPDCALVGAQGRGRALLFGYLTNGYLTEKLTIRPFSHGSAGNRPPEFAETPPIKLTDEPLWITLSFLGQCG